MSHACDSLTVDPTKRLQQKVQDLEGQQAQKIEELTERVQYLDEWCHRWAGMYRNLQSGKSKVYLSETDKVYRQKVVREVDEGLEEV